MKVTLALLSLGVLALCAGLQPEQASAKGAKQVAPVANDPAPKRGLSKRPAKLKLMNTKCWTNQPGCAGNATFGGFKQDMSCAIWWGNDSNRRMDFPMRAGEVRTMYVQYPDLGACRYGAAPGDQPRFAIYVN